jgi:hypothetical protein
MTQLVAITHESLDADSPLGRCTVSQFEKVWQAKGWTIVAEPASPAKPKTKARAAKKARASKPTPSPDAVSVTKNDPGVSPENEEQSNG